MQIAQKHSRGFPHYFAKVTIAIPREYDIIKLQRNNPSKQLGKEAIGPSEGVMLSGKQTELRRDSLENLI